MENLWPQEITEVEVKPPVAILREQASLLGRKTQGIVEARVRQVVAEGEAEFAYRFDLVAPALGQYAYSLFHVTHEIELYPARFVVELSMAREITGDARLSTRVLEAESEDKFIEVLRCILHASKTTHIIGSLLAQARFGEPQEEIPF